MGKLTKERGPEEQMNISVGEIEGEFSKMEINKVPLEEVVVEYLNSWRHAFVKNRTVL